MGASPYQSNFGATKCSTKLPTCWWWWWWIVFVVWLTDKRCWGPSLIYPVGPLSVLDPHIDICVGPPTLALLWSNLICYPLTLLWRNFIYYPLTHQFQAITLGWIKTCEWFWDSWLRLTNWDLVIVQVITYSTPRTLEFKSCPY